MFYFEVFLMYLLSIVDLSPLLYGCAVFVNGSQAAELPNTQRYRLSAMF